MNKTLIIATMSAAGLTTFLLFGQPSAPPEENTATTKEAWSFKEGHGVYLGPTTREKLGLVINEVVTGDIQPEHTTSPAHVYRAASEKPGQTKSAAFIWLTVAEARQLALGQSLDASKSGFAESAKVTSIKAPLNTSTTLVEVLVEIPDPKGRLRVGDFLQLAIKGADVPKKGVTVVPPAAVIESIREPSVYVVNGDSFLRTPVRLGAKQDDKVEIIDGLFEGDEIVTQGAAELWAIEMQAVNGGKGCADGH